jgi:hypothetical protein
MICSKHTKCPAGSHLKPDRWILPLQLCGVQIKADKGAAKGAKGEAAAAGKAAAKKEADKPAAKGAAKKGGKKVRGVFGGVRASAAICGSQIM